MRNGQIDLGSLPVGCRMEPDTVHLQFTGDLQDLEVRLGRRLAPGQETNQSLGSVTLIQDGFAFMNVLNPLRLKSKAELGVIDVDLSTLTVYTPEDQTVIVTEFPRDDTLDPVDSKLVDKAVFEVDLIPSLITPQYHLRICLRWLQG